MKATGIAPLQTITIEDILRACPKVIKAGKLGAQCTKSMSGVAGCVYLGPDGSQCIVGTAMNEVTLRKLVNRGAQSRGIDALVSEGLISVPKEQVSKITHLQRLHDRWSGSLANEGAGDNETKTARKAFYTYLTELKKEYAS